MQHLEIHYAIAPLVIPLIAAGASMLGNWFANKQSSDSNEAVNAANIAATKANNEQARNWAVEDFNKTNAYNEDDDYPCKSHHRTFSHTYFLRLYCLA